ncbi:hypothetical protein ACHAXS_012078 [Conticribra weissflogii]
MVACSSLLAAAFTSPLRRYVSINSISEHPSLFIKGKPFVQQSTVSTYFPTQPLYGYSDSIPLEGKTALITGSSGGIGAAIAKNFARAGANIILHYNSRKDGAISTFRYINNQQQVDNTASGKCLGIVQADFTNSKAVEKMFRTVTDDVLKDNHLDILVNNAGIVTKLAMEDDDNNLSSWHETMAVNLHAPLQLMRLFHKHTKDTQSKRKGGVIINNTSIHGSRSVEYMTAYAASKAALDSLTRGLSCEYAPDGIRVNAIAPGVVPVERTAEAFADPKVQEMWSPHLPVGRLGTVEDIAEATLLLATNEWMSGTVLTIDGGMMGRANMPLRPRPAKPNDAMNEKVGAGSANGDLPSTSTFEVPS